MEEYSDLKFDGDLSFLNENLEEAKKVQKEEIKNESISNSNFQPVTNPQPIEPMRNSNETNQSQPETSSTNAAVNHVPQQEQRVTPQSYSQVGEKKSQLEEIILNSGYGVEMFNNLKMELLELEKEKIIMKYKQDLMMMIIKS
ncbi:hypothetical protein [Flavobacterium sp.]|uniref:hypothetical protein n=1 Tax=Flavobacterium sp. TaxID=239 RepID=UPI0026020B90|nr:hypothetical protein [Flavobacterium sp.]MDD3004525.1 hypothetical protein [Flavobacterium sp.]